jgi:hypothetical protein
MSTETIYNFSYKSENEINFLIKIPVSKAVVDLYGHYFSDLVLELNEIITTPEGAAPKETTPEGAAPKETTSEGAAPNETTPEGATPANAFKVNNFELFSDITNSAIVLAGSIISTGEATLVELTNIGKLLKSAGSITLTGLTTPIAIFYDNSTGESLFQAITSRGVGALAGIVFGGLILGALAGAPIVVAGLATAIGGYIISEMYNYFVDNIFTLFNEILPSTPVPLTPIPLSQPSPLVFDLNNNGIYTLNFKNGVFFDHNTNLFAEKTGWINPNDCFLARDINFNGLIDNGSELFGDNTILSNGQKAINGFEALIDLDLNFDGFINSSDQIWNELLLWQDKNTNGLTDSDELFTLPEVGIIEINLNYNSSDYIDNNGNKHLQNSFFIRDDGSTGGVSDVWFLSDSGDAVYTKEIPILDSVSNLIDFNGIGDVLSLHQAMSLDNGGLLVSLVNQFSNSDPQTAKKLTWDIIYAWTGVTDLDPTSRGPYIEDARKLYAMEKFWGQSFRSLTCGLVYQDNPHQKD